MYALLAKSLGVQVAPYQDQILVINAKMENSTIRQVKNVKDVTHNTMGSFVNNVIYLDPKLIVYNVTLGIGLELGTKVGSASNVQILIVQTVISHLVHVVNVKMGIISMINSA